MASTRKRSLVPILLFCALLTLIVSKVFAVLQPVQLAPLPDQTTIAASDETAQDADPSQIRVTARLAQGGIPTTQTTGTTPAFSSCADIPEQPKDEDVFPSCSVSSIADYVVPSCGGAGQSCGVVNSSSVTVTDSYIGNVRNEVIDLGNGYIKQKSNDIFFIYRRNPDGSVSLLQDTIWGGGPAGGFFTCDGTSEQAFYRVYDGNGNWGNQQYPASASCNSPFTNTSKLGTFKKVGDNYNINDPATPDSQLLVPDSELDACTVSGQTGIPVQNSSRLIFQGQAKCNGVDFDMIAMQNVSGQGAGEVNMYCKGKGLCAFYQNMDFTVEENKPINWPGKDLCNLKAGGSRGNVPTYFEYNIQRECGQTPAKVLSNLQDEYSVSCVPQADYILKFVDKDNCYRTGKGCNNWNTTGDLRFTAGGGLFGLFRNQAAVDARYNTMNGLKDKSRQESIESYLTAKSDKLPLSAQGSRTQFTSQNRADGADLSMYQSPLYKLSTLEQQCDLVYDKLVAVKELCEPFNRIEGTEGEVCAINQFLPNTSLRYTDILSEMTGPNGQSKCLQLMNPDDGNAPAVALRDQILSIDPAMEVAYRPAFLVLATLVGDPLDLNPTFEAPGDESNFWQVDYVEVKVPTFGSDFLHKSNSGSASNPNRAGSTYRDPLRFLADVLTTPEIQEKYRKEEENDRNAVRAATVVPPPTGPVPPGPIIGNGNLPIKCRNAHGIYSLECDNIAKALISFINASSVLPASPGEGEGGSSLTRQYSPPRGWLPASRCFVSEKNLYGNSELTDVPVDPKYRVAEQASQIGSKLEAEDVGKYQKKTEGVADFEANVTDMVNNPNAGDFGQTQVFFVSPHNYTLLYAQNAMLAMLTQEQQQAFLKNENFNSVLKTTGLDEFSGSKEEDFYYENAAPPLPGASPIGTPKEVSVELKRREDEGKVMDSPLMWQVAGSIANIPTRLFTLVSTTLESPVRLFTLGCRGSYATEGWLLGRCTPVAAPNPTSSPVPGDVPPGTDPSNKCIDVFVTSAQAQQAAADISANLPGQQHQSPSFAGWDRYFGVASRPQDQHLFYNDCAGGQSCMGYILDQVLGRSINGQYVNPYLVMSIALNETGGLISSKPGFVGPHFGCGVGGTAGQVIGDGTIENKLQCLLGFFSDNAGMEDDALLRRYGYSNGNRNDNLTKIMGIISKGKAPALCNAPADNGPTPTEE